MLTDINREIDNNTIIVGNFSTPVTSMDRSYKQKINKETIVIYRTFHPKSEEYTFFSNVPGTFSKIGHMPGHEKSHSKFKRIEIISSIFF